MDETKLKARELDAILCTMKAVAFGSFFDDSEFHILFGVTREELKEVISKWPDVNDLNPEVVELSINNSFANLLGYLNINKSELDKYINIDRQSMRDLYIKWKTSRGLTK